MTQNIDASGTISLADQKKKLYKLLQTAFELELGTMPPYLMAILSIRPPHNRVASNIIHEIVMEEMLHLLLVGNLMTSLGGSIELTEGTIPTYPLRLKFDDKITFEDRQFDVNLAPFSKETIKTFTDIEQPRDWELLDQRLMFVEIDVPSYTVGGFYAAIGTTLKNLCQQYGEKEVFACDGSKQVNQAYYWWGRGEPIIITDLESALRALSIIVLQGEGTSVAQFEAQGKPFENRELMAHFYRFREILCEQCYRPGDDPRKDPSGDRLDVNYGPDAVFPIITNAKATDYAAGSLLSQLNFDFNRRYTLMLTQVVDALNGTPKVMYTAIMNGMHGLMPIAAKMVAMPIEGDRDGRTGAPSFEWIDPFS
jgi:hypothetical protein